MHVHLTHRRPPLRAGIVPIGLAVVGDLATGDCSLLVIANIVPNHTSHPCSAPGREQPPLVVAPPYAPTTSNLFAGFAFATTMRRIVLHDSILSHVV
ncbi:hypothetical protein B296_00008932 [Ensete ventricosum]|uniref:Uncharacterized protein n=1 Tax=Ensete ventricosum TaxID=4639 RepID=A0A426YSX9_ENSVE|nr:hypothetical protein B296_00008932 [Ensete ventricosum]